MKKALIIIGIIAVLAVLGLYSFYNRLVTMSEQIDGQWANVENQYQRRFDLIPNIVNAVKGVMVQEQKIFGDIAEARTRYSGASTVGEKAAAATQVESAFGRLLAIMENYPEIKSSENVTEMMIQLEGTENRIAVERGRFNEAVRGYNVLVKRFPGNMIAGMFGFEEQIYFEAAEGAEVPPTVDLE